MEEKIAVFKAAIFISIVKLGEKIRIFPISV